MIELSFRGAEVAVICAKTGAYFFNNELSLRGAGIAVICAKTGAYFINKYSPMHLLLGFPNHVLDLPLEGRQTIIQGPETPVFYYSN